MEAVKGMHLPTLVPFLLGYATGLVAFVRRLRSLLGRYHGLTVALLLAALGVELVVVIQRVHSRVRVQGMGVEYPAVRPSRLGLPSLN